VLGLTEVRHRATEEQIRKAHRFKVLKHHPDKRRAAGEDIRDDDDYFSCITKAQEILANPIKRRGFDSVDPTFDDDVPSEQKIKGTPAAAKDFFASFGPAFDRNSKWSSKKHVPKLGDDTLARDKVDQFYQFWYEFVSWREYSYLDEEDKEKGSDRDERRWIEKNNRVERLERKREEMKRIRKLVDNSYSSDPRVLRFRAEDLAEKANKKKAKQDAAKFRRDEEERVKREQEDKEKKVRVK
jgi:DnaJ family protein C protein 2